MNHECTEHELVYQSVDDYNHHKQFECERMLTHPNVCTYQNEQQRCCQNYYSNISSLILHCYKKHQKYACANCFKLFDTSSALEKHIHSQNYREPEYLSAWKWWWLFTNLSITGPFRCRYCSSSHPSKALRYKHELIVHQITLTTTKDAPGNVCGICERKYVTKSNLYRHQRVAYNLVGRCGLNLFKIVINRGAFTYRIHWMDRSEHQQQQRWAVKKVIFIKLCKNCHFSLS